MGPQSVSVGRTVHYMAYGSADGTYPQAERAAVVVEVIDGAHGDVRLCIFSPTGMHWNTAHYSEDRQPGTWCWPPKV